MPYAARTMLFANAAFGSLANFDHTGLLAILDGAETVVDAADALGAFDVLDDQNAAALRSFLTDIPPALDAAMMAGLRSALGRGVHTQLTWQPGYDFEVRMWEASEGSDGLFNVHIFSPHPPEVPPAS